MIIFRFYLILLKVILLHRVIMPNCMKLSRKVSVEQCNKCIIFEQNDQFLIDFGTVSTNYIKKVRLDDQKWDEFVNIESKLAEYVSC